MSIRLCHRVDSHEARKLEQLEAQLIAMFCPPLRAEEVQRCLIDCVANYESARVRSYLPVLIEREATKRLRDVTPELTRTTGMIGALT